LIVRVLKYQAHLLADAVNVIRRSRLEGRESKVRCPRRFTQADRAILEEPGRARFPAPWPVTVAKAARAFYKGLTQGKKLVVVVGQRKALATAVKNNKTEQRFSGLLSRLKP
jgi:hypothetical protein